jgi:hypothetical protein
MLNKSEFEELFGQSNRAAKYLRLIESAFPRLASFMSAYCLIVLCKADPNPRPDRSAGRVGRVVSSLNQPSDGGLPSGCPPANDLR